VSDIDTAVVVDSLKVLDPEWPIREADMMIGGRGTKNAPTAFFEQIDQGYALSRVGDQGTWSPTPFVELSPCVSC
jgi:hypothetical protein